MMNTTANGVRQVQEWPCSDGTDVPVPQEIFVWPNYDTPDVVWWVTSGDKTVPCNARRARLGP